MATPDSYRSIAERFGIAKSSLSNIFVRLINSVNKLAPKYVKWPNEESHSLKKFRKCLGCVDGTYVPCAVPIDQQRVYTNRKCFTAITLQVICDANMKHIPNLC